MTLKKIGNCNRCGKCCNIMCKHFTWIALRNIKKGETFLSGLKDGVIKAKCKIFSTHIIEEACTKYLRDNFPFGEAQRPPHCGYEFIEEEESR